jgi:hypothetical protein
VWAATALKVREYLHGCMCGGCLCTFQYPFALLLSLCVARAGGAAVAVEWLFLLLCGLFFRLLRANCLSDTPRMTVATGAAPQPSQARSAAAHPANSHIIELIDCEVRRDKNYIAMILEAGDIDLAKVLTQKNAARGLTAGEYCV